MADPGNAKLDPKRLKPEHLAILAELIKAKSDRKLDPEEAFLEALEFASDTLSILRNKLVHSAPEKPGETKELLDQLIGYMQLSGKGATEIARELNVNRATVTLWRSGKGKPGKKALRNIAKLLATHPNCDHPVQP